MADRSISTRDLAYCGLFGAAAMLLPVLFHLVSLGNLFMPMYLPLVALAFFVRPLPAAVAAGLVPILSGAITGMPPFFPPVAVFMAVELAVMALLISSIRGRWPNLNELVVLVPVLLLGRIVNAGLMYGFSAAIGLPAAFMAGFSAMKGWPGLILMAVVVPSVARAGKMLARKRVE